MIFSECERGWTKSSIGETEKCLKVIGNHRRVDAVQKCLDEYARLPLPKNLQEDKDLFNAVILLDSTIEWVVIDANDQVQEGEWRDSSNNLIPFDEARWAGSLSDNTDSDRNFVKFNLDGWEHAHATPVRPIVCEKTLLG